MKPHTIAARIAQADEAINREDFDTLIEIYTDAAVWRCAIDNSYGHDLLAPAG